MVIADEAFTGSELSDALPQDYGHHDGLIIAASWAPLLLTRSQTEIPARRSDELDQPHHRSGEADSGLFGTTRR